MKQSGFFDVEERLSRLSGLGDQLEAFSRTVDFEVFRPELTKALAYSDGSKGGRPPFDPVLMTYPRKCNHLKVESDREGYGRMKRSRFTEEQMEGSKNP